MTLVSNKEIARYLTGKLLLLGLLLLTLSALPLSAAARGGSSSSLALQRYIVELQDPPLAMYDGRELSVESRDRRRRLPATARPRAGIHPRERYDYARTMGGSPA